jgi:glycosyltransferase involved in cell wall biosynthesis
MIRLFLNGLAASAGGGLTYLRNVLPQMSARKNVHVTVALSPNLRDEFRNLTDISFLEPNASGGSATQFWHQQAFLPRLIRESGADALISAGNFALRNSPVPQILLSRNSLYTSIDFFRDLRARGDYRLLLDTRIKRILAKRSIQWADCTVAPSRAFADDLQCWTGKAVTCIHHGFARDIFFGNKTSLPEELAQKFCQDEGILRLLFVSHYNYYRNFETLLHALPLIQEALGTRKVKLFLTCTFQSRDNPGSYRAESAAALVKQLGIVHNVVELGAVSYSQLHHVYRACDVYVSPAYAESFAHPLVEAMASGLPVVASDLPVHREICCGAALYFSRFSEQELAREVLRIESSKELAQELAARGLSRSQDFSWERHVDQIIELAASLIAGEGLRSPPSQKS